jgi:hypothetical protein|tara:strand:- start:146 stop:343 length:198 start_codon:yes stop_codon:yes gene_type:complete
MSNRLNQRRGKELQNKRSPRKKRAKSFKSEESAKAHAEKLGFKEYTIKNLRNPEAKVKKLIVVKA